MGVKYKVLAALTALLTAGTLAACGGDDSSSSGGSSTTGGSAAKSNGEPLKIALIPPSSGALAVFGADAAKAWEYAASEANANGGVDGHKVEIVKAETDGQPPTTIRAARKAATQDKAHFIAGVMTSPEHGALAQQLPSMNAIDLNALGKDDALTGKNCSPNAFRAVQSNTMDVNAIASTLSQLPAKKWAIQAVDYSTGHSAAQKFKQAAEKAGKQVVLESYAPLNTTEFGSYITKLKNADADGLFAVEYGADGVAFVNQGAQFKLFDKYKTVVGFNMVSEPLFKALGNKIVGFYNNLGYDVASANPKNKSFVDGYTKKYGTAPYYVPADNYLAAQMLFEAVKKAGSVDPAKVKEAMNGLAFDSIAGPVSMSSDGQLVRQSYLGQVVKKSNGVGGLGWKVVASAAGDQTHPAPDPTCKTA
jgi:ABC-type branched-subunit amino acid transport system substrate-binding protein